MTVWRTTVGQLLVIFRDTLRALVPHVERARIEWRESSAYDDWDEIAQTLFETIVLSSLLWAMPEEEREYCEFPNYNMSYASYAGKAVILVNDVSNQEKLVFHSFGTQRDPFDKVCVIRVDRGGRIIEGDLLLMDADTAMYSLKTRDTTLIEIAVDL